MWTGRVPLLAAGMLGSFGNLGEINTSLGLSIQCQDQVGDHLHQFKITDARRGHPARLRLAGEVADGVIPMLTTPDSLVELRALLGEGAARAGRSLEGFRIVPTIWAMSR